MTEARPYCCALAEWEGDPNHVCREARPAVPVQETDCPFSAICIDTIRQAH